MNTIINWSSFDLTGVLSAIQGNNIITFKENKLGLTYNFGNIVVQKETSKFYIVQCD